MAYALRIDTEKAHVRTGEITWYDRDKGEVIAHPERFGDVVVARKDGWPSYHLAVTWDDHLQGITLVTRGNDLFEATDIHRLASFAEPRYARIPSP